MRHFVPFSCPLPNLAAGLLAGVFAVDRGSAPVLQEPADAGIEIAAAIGVTSRDGGGACAAAPFRAAGVVTVMAMIQRKGVPNPDAPVAAIKLCC
ncbi:hypothetical protein ACFQU1_05770 [Chelatococcus sp. GCM10030263]|uniref:hypothetical protein n=1 Tax=Chelatococcus sp. GCM10030263 TaxID=3273387 RepID=UPI003623D407